MRSRWANLNIPTFPRLKLLRWDFAKIWYKHKHLVLECPNATGDLTGWWVLAMAFAVAPKIISLSLLNRARKEDFGAGFGRRDFGVTDRHGILTMKCAIERSSNGSDGKKGGVSNSNYVVPLDNSSPFSNSSCITRPLAEILRDLNKRIPDTIVKGHVPGDPSASTFIPWYFAALWYLVNIFFSLLSNVLSIRNTVSGFHERQGENKKIKRHTAEFFSWIYGHLIKLYCLLLFFGRYHANRMLSFYAPGASLELSIDYYSY